MISRVISTGCHLPERRPKLVTNDWACRLTPSKVSSGKKNQPCRSRKNARNLDLFGFFVHRIEVQDGRLDVRVLGDLVRRLMVHVVLAVPPGQAHPAEQRSEHQAGAVIGLAGDEDLPVRRVMAEEPEVREHQAEQRGQNQREPAVAQQDDADRDRRDRQDHQAALHRVVAVAALHQPRLLDRFQQL